MADFAPVTLMCVYPNILAVPNSSPDRSVPDFIARAKADPGKITYASSGIGTSLHLAGELFKRMAGVDLTHIPYRGAGPALNDLIPGRVDAIFANFPSTLPLCAERTVARPRGDDGAAPAGGAATCRRSRSSFPATTCRPGSRCSSRRRRRPISSRGCISDAVAALNTSAGEGALRAARRDRGRLDAGRACDAFLKAEIDRWGPVIKAAGIKETDS